MGHSNKGSSITLSTSRVTNCPCGWMCESFEPRARDRLTRLHLRYCLHDNLSPRIAARIVVTDANENNRVIDKYSLPDRHLKS
jgi:hypothetical protein